MEHLESAMHWIVEFVERFGYAGIFIMSFLESTFVPIPAEVTMVPAGYLVSQGKMHFIVVLLSSISGTVGGSLFNYWLAKHFGRRFFQRYGKYFFLDADKLLKMEQFFLVHGPASIFSGRLIPGVRHCISFPAGLAHMNLRKFVFYTATGGAVWMSSLTLLGYLIGNQKELLHRYIRDITVGIILLVIVGITLYVWRHRKNQRRAKAGLPEQP